MSIRNRIKKTFLFFLSPPDQDLLIVSLKGIFETLGFKIKAEANLLDFLNWYKEYNIKNKNELKNLEVETTIEQTSFLQSFLYKKSRYFVIHNLRGFLKYPLNSYMEILKLMSSVKICQIKFLSFRY